MLSKRAALKETFLKKKPNPVHKFADFLLELEMSCVVDFFFFFKRRQRSQCFLLS